MERFIVGALLVGGLATCDPAIERNRGLFAEETGLAARLRALDSNVFPAGERNALSRMLATDVRARRDEANRRDARAWAQVKSRAGWERFRDRRIDALRRSLGSFPPVPKTLNAQVTGSIHG